MNQPKIQLIKGDCLEVMPRLIEEGVRVDLVLTDIPYGTIKGLKLNGSSYQNDDDTSWDVVIPIEPMMENIQNIMRQKAHAILFSGGMLTPQLRLHYCANLKYLYPLYWKKNVAGNSLMAKKAPVSFIEELGVWHKPYDVEMENPLRDYAQKLLQHIIKLEGGASKTQIFTHKYLEEAKARGFSGHTISSHFFCKPTTIQWTLCKKEAYDWMIERFQIDKLDYFIPYEEMVRINQEKKKIFNLPEGKKTSPNVLEYAKPSGKEAGLHPTQKPVEMLEYLILQYTNPGDTVLDFTMGSGSTAIACLNTGRNFIGIELDDKYYDIAVERIAQHENRIKDKSEDIQ